jgi:hypothetical protein
MNITAIIVDENNAHRYQEANFTVAIAGWSKRRPVYRRGPTLVIDIAVSDCMCNTCIRRFESVLFSMRDRNVKYEAGSWNKSCAVRFVNENGFSDDEICKYLSEQLGLQVTDVQKVEKTT